MKKSIFLKTSTDSASSSVVNKADMLDKAIYSTKASIEQTNAKINDVKYEMETRLNTILEEHEKVTIEMANQHLEQVAYLEKRQKTTAKMYKISLAANIVFLVAIIIFGVVLASFSVKYNVLDEQVAQLTTQYNDMLSGCRDISSRVNELIDDFKELTDDTSSGPTEVVDFNLTDITAKSNLFANNFNDIIDIYLVDRGFDKSKMDDLGEAIYKMENEYDVNGLFCLAVSALESTFGTSDAAINKNNLFGFIDNSGSLMEFESPEECVMYWGELIRKYYIDAGLDTIDLIQPKYCPNSTTWAPSIRSLFEEFASYV